MADAEETSDHTQTQNAGNVWLASVVMIALSTGTAAVVNHFFVHWPTGYALLLGLLIGGILAYVLATNKVAQRLAEGVFDLLN